MSETKKPTIARDATKNCTAKNGPESCRYHGKQYAKHPMSTQFKTFQDVFVKVEAELSPSEVIEKQYASASDEMKASQQFQREADSIRERMSSDESGAVAAYSDEYGSHHVRLVLANPGIEYDFNGDPIERVRRRIKYLDEAISNHGESMEGVELWRGIKSLHHEMKEAEVGNTIEFSSYVSTTVDRSVALSFSKSEYPILVKMKAKKGLKVAGYYGNEQEVLLPHSTKFKVIKIQENVHVRKIGRRFDESPMVEGVTLIELEEI